MNNPIRIAVDAMGGENSPYKIIKGIDHRFSTPECLELIKEAVEQMPLA